MADENVKPTWKHPQYKTVAEAECDLALFFERFEWYKSGNDYLERRVHEWRGSKSSIGRDLIKEVLEELDLPPDELVRFVANTLLSFAFENNDDDVRKALKPFWEGRLDHPF